MTKVDTFIIFRAVGPGGKNLKIKTEKLQGFFNFESGSASRKTAGSGSDKK